MAVNPNTFAAQQGAFLIGDSTNIAEPQINTPTQGVRSSEMGKNVDPRLLDATTAVENNGGGSATIPVSVFQPFASVDVITNQVLVETTGLWTNNSSSLNSYYTSSELNDSQKQYYLAINSATSSCNPSTEFYIAYGNRFGYGALEGDGQPNDTPTRAIYNQYRQLLLTPNDYAFSFKSGSTFINSDSIYVINFNSVVKPGNATNHLMVGIHMAVYSRM